MKKETPKDGLSHTKEVADTKAAQISLAPLDFEDALSALLQVKPVDNKELAKPKKKSKPKTEK